MLRQCLVTSDPLPGGLRNSATDSLSYKIPLKPQYFTLTLGVARNTGIACRKNQKNILSNSRVLSRPSLV